MTKTTTTRQYDCTKPGNANKAQCRTAAKQSPTGKTTGAVSKTTKDDGNDDRLYQVVQQDACNLPYDLLVVGAQDHHCSGFEARRYRAPHD